MDTNNRFHCGIGHRKKEEILFDARHFCCKGCKTVYFVKKRKLNINSFCDFKNALGTMLSAKANIPFPVGPNQNFSEVNPLAAKSFFA